jgi:hypothetical protein
MKRIVAILLLLIGFSLNSNAQFWINFGWGEPECGTCSDMINDLGLNSRQAYEYERIVHSYGQRIEKETRRQSIYWDDSARRIYKLRMERDRKLQRILSPDQFYLYLDISRENPTFIHDWIGWYNNPLYPRYTPSNECMMYEDNYWHNRWEYRNNRWYNYFDAQGWYPGKFPTPKQRPNNRFRPERPQGNTPRHLNRPGNGVNRPGNGFNRPENNGINRPQQGGNGNNFKPGNGGQGQQVRPEGQSRPNNNQQQARPNGQNRSGQQQQQARPNGQGNQNKQSGNEQRVESNSNNKQRPFSSRSGRTARKKSDEKDDKSR